MAFLECTVYRGDLYFGLFLKFNFKKPIIYIEFSADLVTEKYENFF